MAADNGDKATGVNRRAVLKKAGVGGTVALTGLAGCSGGGDGGDGDDGGETETETATETETGGDGGSTSDSEPITIGGVHPFVGSYAPLGEGQRNGVKAAIQRINENGGINGREVTDVYEDTELSPETGRQKARKLVKQDNVDLLVGGVSSAVDISVLEVANQNNLIYLIPGAANQLTGEGCQEIGFRYEASAAQIARSMAAWAVDNFGTNLWIHNADYAWGNSTGSAIEKWAKDYNSDVQLVDRSRSELGASDFSSYVSQISASDADWVYTGLNGGDAVNFLKQAESFGLKNQLDIVSPTNAFQFIRTAAGSAATGTFSAFRYKTDFDAPGNPPFVERYQNMFDGLPENFGHVSWVTVLTWAKAARAAGTLETDAVIDELVNVEFEGPMGPVSYRECDHQALRTIAMGEIVGSEGKGSDLEVLNTVSGEAAAVPCEDTGCSF